MRAALVLLLASPLAWGDVAPGRGKSQCEINPRLCSWPGAERSMRAMVDADGKTDKVKTSMAAPARGPEAKQIRAAKPMAPFDEKGNLPGYMSTDGRRPGSPDGFVLVAEKTSGALLPGVRAGDVLIGVLEQSVKASPSVPTPIRVRITAGKLRGAIVLGAATLDRELKRILLVFERLRIPGNETAYALRATGLAPSGQVGLEGDHHTQERTYFAGEILAAAAAGYADATTQRTQTLTGGYQIEPSVGSAAKQGAVTALSKTADRFAERSRTAPEYTEIEAGREVQIIIQESPTEVSGS